MRAWSSQAGDPRRRCPGQAASPQDMRLAHQRVSAKNARVSDEAAFITGATLPVDGGITLGVLRYPER
jgi:hypothetical protein